MKRNILLVLLGVVWGIAVGFGFSKLYNYEYKSGTANYIAKQWPSKSVIQPHKNFYQLVMVVHPQCPCTRATIGELELIMAQAHGKVEAYVLFIKPKGYGQQWVKTDLYRTVCRIPGVHAIIDDEGQEVRLFGGTISGQTFLYDPHGQLVFTGGITASRGHSGDNIGRSTIVALIYHQPVSVHSTPFFGCSLMNDMPGLIAQKGRP